MNNYRYGHGRSTANCQTDQKFPYLFQKKKCSNVVSSGQKIPTGGRQTSWLFTSMTEVLN